MTFDARAAAHALAREHRRHGLHGDEVEYLLMSWCGWGDDFNGKEGHGKTCDKLTATLQRAHDAGLARAEEIARARGDAFTGPATPLNAHTVVEVSARAACMEVADAIAAARARVPGEGETTP